MAIGGVPSLLLTADVQICTPDWHTTSNSFSLDSADHNDVSDIFDAMEGVMLFTFTKASLMVPTRVAKYHFLRFIAVCRKHTVSFFRLV